MSYPDPWEIYAAVPELLALKRWHRDPRTVSSQPVSLESSILSMLRAYLRD